MRRAGTGVTAPGLARIAAFALGLGLLLPCPVAAQTEADLRRVVDRVAAAWARGDAGAIVALASAEGLMLELQDESVGPLPSRQAAAALRRMLERRDTEGVRAGMIHVVGGLPARAFGELTWVFRPEGTTIPLRGTVFVALVQEGGAWRLTQIRLLR